MVHLDLTMALKLPSEKSKTEKDQLYFKLATIAQINKRCTDLAHKVFLSLLSSTSWI